jgi:hypothetical protein
MSSRVFCFAFVGLFLTLRAAGQAPVHSPFDKDDPEIATLRQLKWQGINFDALDARTRCTVTFALSKGLGDLGTKADSRLDLLIDYLDDQGLGEAFATEKGLESDFKPPAYEDLKKVAAAYVKSPAGSAKYSDEFATTGDDLLGRYITLYEKSARREYDQTVESRMQVRSMALFLERKGKLEDFKSWAVDERKRRKEEQQKALAEKRAAAEQANAEKRDQARIAAEQRRQQQEELANRQLQYSMEQNQAGEGSGGAYDNDNWWGDDDGYWGGYYNVNAYRGAVRDHSNDAIQRWRTGRPSQLPARGRGGRR